MSIASVRLSKYSVVVNKNEQVQIKAEVINDTGAVDKSFVEAIVEDKDVVNYVGGSGARYKDYYDTVITIKGVSAGSTTVRVYSVVDRSKYAILNVNVVASDEVPGENYHIPYTIFLAPEEVTVQKNQLFCVRARGMGGDYKSELVKSQNYRGRWEFVPDEQSAGKLTLEYKQEYGGTNTITWFKAHAAGTYHIKVYNPTYPEFGIATCTVHVTNQKTEDEEIRLVCGNESVEFYYNDDISIYESTAIRKNPFKTSLVIYDNDEFEYIEDHTTDIGWIIPETRVVSFINSEKDFVRIARGYDYGIVPVTFYLKSNPYIYYPVWVEVLGGHYEKYISPVTPEPTDVVEIELSENVKVVQKGGADGVVLAFGKNSNGDVGGRIKVQRLDGTTTANVSVFSDTIENGKYRIYIRANADVPDGVIYYNVYCEEFPNVTRLLTIHVVEDPTDYLVPINKAVTGIKLDRNTLSLGVGAKAHLGYTIYPNGAYIQDVSWSSSNSDIVTVDQSGNVVGVGKGNALVTVTTVDSGYTDTCQVSVGGYIQVTNLSVSPKSLNLVKNASAKLTASITPSNATDKTVTWTSQDSSIATVDANGNVTGISAGYTTITASVDGGVIKDVVTVAVFDDESDIPSTDPNHPELNVRSISLSSSNVRMQVGTSRNLVATITYEDGHRTIAAEMSLWSSSDTSIVSVGEDGHIKALAVGVAVVTVRAKDNPTVNVRCTVTVVNSGSDIDQDTEEKESVDYIYRIDYDGDSFKADMLFSGNLGFSLDHPIESVVYYETEDIQKIYWVDGIHPLRFMNFMAEPGSEERVRWADGTYFDSNRSVNFGVEVDVSKSNSGNTRANGVVQYLMTYYNKHGQESGYVWISDLIYLSPVNTGGSADGTNMNSVTLRLSNLDTRFDHFRIYSVFRSALDGKTVSYIVFDGTTNVGEVIVIDDNSHLVSIDSSRLLYLGSQFVMASTLTHKDQTLFLGDIQSVGKEYYNDLETIIKATMFSDVEKGFANDCIRFVYSDGSTNKPDIPYDSGENYVYNSQLVDSSSKITTFKGGEKYRFGLSFRRGDGTMTEAFWIGDKVNDKYPVIDGNKIHRVVVECSLPAQLVSFIKEIGFTTANLMIAEATNADRSVKAQGIINPTVFNVWDRFKNRTYSSSSWISRPRQSDYAWKHFQPINKSTVSTGEIQCNYWTTDEDPNPYYRIRNYGSDNSSYDEVFDSGLDFDYFVILYKIATRGAVYQNYGSFILVTAKLISFTPEAISELNNYDFYSQQFVLALQELASEILRWSPLGIQKDISRTYTVPSGNFAITIYTTTCDYGKYRGNDTKNHLHNCIASKLLEYSIPSQYIVPLDQDGLFYQWCVATHDNMETDYFFQYNTGLVANTDSRAALNIKRGQTDRWYSVSDVDVSSSPDYAPSYYKKHLMFIDENTITLNSPEFDHEAMLLDNADKYKLRIVGVAKISSVISDYTVDASPGKLAGENLVNQKFGAPNGILSWPLWREYGITERNESDDTPEFHHSTKNRRLWDSIDYIRDGSIRRYWLHMWHHPGSITTFVSNDQNQDGSFTQVDETYSELHSKTFANLKYSNVTWYNNLNVTNNTYDLESVRLFNYTSSQYVGLKVGGETRYYDGVVNESLSMPSKLRYPILYSSGSFATADDQDFIIVDDNQENTMFSDIPVQITYSSSPHLVMSLPTNTMNGYVQTILPRFSSHANESVILPARTSDITGCVLPWAKKSEDAFYPFDDYSVNQGTFALSGNPITNTARTIGEDDSYLYIGEIYYPFDDDTRYGGATESAVQNNRFIIAGPQHLVSDMTADGISDILIGNQGDTYFQRWDCLKTKPYSTGAVNNVVDITSVMIETHVNIDGRTDLQRGVSHLASIDADKFGQINPVYSQHNNFIVQRDLDSDFNLDSYRSSITWSLEKHDSEDIDEWSHVTLASTLKLDGDKGVCRALRRMGNSIIAFQDRGISEILFNSRTQLSTQDGVPVEIANSGKVDGKRYITNKYGCVNKWSIIEGKNALYFVDNINKAFCSFNGQAIDNLSTRLGFGAWFREINNIESWTPSKFNNIISYYDKVHSDIYLVRKNDDKPCLVYNETLETFTSFFDYREVPMITNVEDRLVSFRDSKLWLQNEGLYCNFFGKQYDYWTQYRVTPDPFGDKIWTNIDYRADFFEVLDDNAEPVVSESELINGDIDDTYKEWETFTDFKVWDEYQDTGFTLFAHEHFDRDDVRKKFRIWRLVIPRALKEGTNKHGMDRIRNPWINLLFRKNNVDGKYLMQLHDIVVKYFE